MRWMHKTKTDSDPDFLFSGEVSKKPKGQSHRLYHMNHKGLQLEKRPFSQTTRPKTAMITFLIGFLEKCHFFQDLDGSCAAFRGNREGSAGMVLHYWRSPRWWVAVCDMETTFLRSRCRKRKRPKSWKSRPVDSGGDDQKAEVWVNETRSVGGPRKKLGGA